MRAVYWAAAAVLGALVVLGATGTVWYKVDRTAMVQAVCKAGGPNLSRPPEVPADDLDCAVLGPRQRVSGTLHESFENSTLIIGSHVEYRDGSLVNDAAWLSTTPGIMNRGGEALRSQLNKPVNGLCGLGMASVTADGWMTVSDGEYGHLGLWGREFYAERIVSVSPPPTQAVQVMYDAVARHMPSDICASMDAAAR